MTHRPLRSHRLAINAGVAAMLLAAPAARAQLDVLSPVPYGEDTGIVGLGLANRPAYLGSDQRRTRIAPMLDYRWSSGWFAGTTYGAGYNFSKERRMQYGARLSLDGGRDEDDAAALAGMGDIKPRPEIGAFFNWLVGGNDPRWSLIGTLAATRLVGDAAASPIVRDKTALSGLFGARYRF